MTAREILSATQGAVLRVGICARDLHEPNESDRALVALRDLLVSFLDATDKGCPESMKSMSIDQARLLNQLHLAVGL